MTYSRPAGAVTIITQTRVRDSGTDAFAKLQATISAAVAEQPGFIEQSVLPPNPPAQVDWVILQRFVTSDDAVAWLRSERRRQLLTEIRSLVAGADDVHLVRDAAAGALPSPVAAVITTRVRIGREKEYRAWEQRIAAAQACYPGFQGYRFEAPIPGVQENFVALLRFESDETLQAWMNSPERHNLLEEAAGLTDDVHARIVRSGFSQWFPDAHTESPAWKMNMVVLLLLYPVVFLFGFCVQGPILIRRMNLPFWLALFIGNVASVVILNYLVPWASTGLRWWLSPAPGRSKRMEWAGAGLIVGCYGILMLVFSLM